jgi:prepilin-type N-terminal cleavage/methylation domain-containing protein/prepilin-type processing-associated H-X9-DG protein
MRWRHDKSRDTKIVGGQSVREKLAARGAVKVTGGFSLLELLTVIAIISLLIGILLPTALKVREASNCAKCFSNLRQIGAAFNAYADDNNSCLVPGDYLGLIDGFSEPGAGNWADILVDARYLKVPTGTYTAATDADFDAWMLDEDTVFRCPDGQEIDGAADYPTSQTDARGTYYFSRGSDVTQHAVLIWYAVNCIPRLPGVPLPAQDLRPLPFNFLPDEESGSANWSITRMGRLSARVPLVFDGVWCFNGDPARINARHGNGRYTNILFADSHCESQMTSTLPNNDWYLH